MTSRVPLSTDHPNQKVRERAYAAQDALRTMQNHEAIMKNPRLLKDAQTLAKQQIAGLSKVVKKK